MNITSRHKSLLLALLALPMAFTSCDDDNGLRGNRDNCITWNVISSSMQNGRALIEDDASLQSMCSTGKSIGIKSSFEIDGVITHNILGNPDGDVSLTYSTNTSWDNYFGWTYGETASEWNIGAKYTFNAYYPQNVISEITTSETSPFVIRYNTSYNQEDLMMAYNYVDTDLPTFKSGEAVQLYMLHVLSALKFRFAFANTIVNELNGTKTIVPYAESDKLTAFWVENTQIDKGIYTIGELEFGSYNSDGTVNGEEITWNSISRPTPSTATSPRKIYAWEDAVGIEFASSATSILSRAIAYSTNADNRYAQNNGFLLIIPQENDETFNICFQLKSTGDKVHRITLPHTTYEPGMRYYYDIYLGSTSVDIDLTIADWNELKSSVDIPL